MTDKEKLFCETYLENGFNATQASITAGYSENSARQIATNILSKVYIRKYLDEQIDLMLSDKKELTKKIIDECKKYAFMSDGEMDMLSVRPSDKKQYLEMLGKYLALFNDKSEVVHKTIDEDGNEKGMNYIIELS